MNKRQQQETKSAKKNREAAERATAAAANRNATAANPNNAATNHNTAAAAAENNNAPDLNFDAAAPAAGLVAGGQAPVIPGPYDELSKADHKFLSRKKDMEEHDLRIVSLTIMPL